MLDRDNNAHSRAEVRVRAAQLDERWLDIETIAKGMEMMKPNYDFVEAHLPDAAPFLAGSIGISTSRETVLHIALSIYERHLPDITIQLLSDQGALLLMKWAGFALLSRAWFTKRMCCVDCRNSAVQCAR